MVARTVDTDKIPGSASRSVILTLYWRGFHDEIVMLAETGQINIEDKDTLVFLMNLWLGSVSPQPHRVIELATLAIKRTEAKAGHAELVKETFKHMVKYIADKKYLCQILNSLVCVSDPTLSAFEEALKDYQDQKYLIIFLIFMSRLKEAQSLYSQYKVRNPKDDLLELLLVGRNNSLPASFKIIEADPDLARLHFTDLKANN